jgi:hypothetical protein
MSNEIDKTELETVLIDVRTAYRLIFSYQHRLMSSIQKLAGEYKLIYGAPKFCSTPQLKSFFKLSRWSWDYLPIYHFEFRFKISDEFHLCVVHVSDSGFYENIDPTNKDRLNIDKFKSAEKSKSFIYLLYCHKDLSNELRNKLSLDKAQNEHIDTNETPYYGKRY